MSIFEQGLAIKTGGMPRGRPHPLYDLLGGIDPPLPPPKAFTAKKTQHFNLSNFDVITQFRIANYELFSYIWKKIKKK